MKASIKVENPNEVVVTMTMTMPIEQWKQVRRDIKGAPFYGPTHILRNAIDDLVSKASANFDMEAEA